MSIQQSGKDFKQPGNGDVENSDGVANFLKELVHQVHNLLQLGVIILKWVANTHFPEDIQHWHAKLSG